VAEAPDLKNQMNQLIRGYWVTQAIFVVAELGIADLLAGGPAAPAELARATGVNSDLLYRVLRALASIGIFLATAGRLTPGGYREAGAVVNRRATARKDLYQSWKAPDACVQGGLRS
jgi:hypothetical protein